MSSCIKLIVTDLDNTLLQFDKSISQYTIEVLSRCKKNGFNLAFASARSVAAISNYLHNDFPDYIIANNGATIIDKQGKIILNQPIEEKIVSKLINRCKKENSIKQISLQGNKANYSNDPNISQMLWATEYNAEFCDFKRLPNDEFVKISTECITPAVIKGIVDEFDSLHLYENQGEPWQQVMRNDSTKLNAIKFLVKKLNLKLEQAVAFGDDNNDMDMIVSCGIGVAVSNAIKSLKWVASDICEDNNSDGVARWIHKNLLPAKE